MLNNYHNIDKNIHKIPIDGNYMSLHQQRLFSMKPIIRRYVHHPRLWPAPVHYIHHLHVRNLGTLTFVSHLILIFFVYHKIVFVVGFETGPYDEPLTKVGTYFFYILNIKTNTFWRAQHPHDQCSLHCTGIPSLVDSN